MSMFPIQVAAEAAVLAAVPREAFSGVRFVKIDDKTTWRINFSETATKAERDAAEAALAAFDPVAEANRPKPKPKDELTLLKERVAALEAKVK